MQNKAYLSLRARIHGGEKVGHQKKVEWNMALNRRSMNKGEIKSRSDYLRKFEGGDQGTSRIRFAKNHGRGGKGGEKDVAQRKGLLAAPVILNQGQGTT